MMPSKLFNRISRGFTLIETLIYTTLAGVTILVAGQIFTSGLNTRSLIEAEQALIVNKRFIEFTLFSRLTDANTINTPTSGSSSTFEFEAIDPTEDPVVFELSGTDLMMTLGANDPVQLNADRVRVTNFSVTRLSGTPAALLIEMDLETDTSAGATPSISMTQTFTLRYD